MAALERQGGHSRHRGENGTVLDQGDHNKGLQEPLLLWCRYCIIFSMKYVSLSQTIQLLGHRRTGTTATFLHLPLLSCQRSWANSAAPQLLGLRARKLWAFRLWCLQSRWEMLQGPGISHDRSCCYLPHSSVRPGSAQCPASVKRTSWSICKRSAVGLRHSFLSFPRQNSGSHCVCYEVCSFLYFSTPPIVRQITDLIIVFQRRTKKHYGIKVHINFKIHHHFRNVEM